MADLWPHAPSPWSTTILRDMLRTQRREARHQSRLTRCLWWWSATLAGSNVAHYLGHATLGYGVALAVQVGLCVCGVVQLWRAR